MARKNAKKEVYDKLVAALSEYKGEKDAEKFDRKLRKASKLFVPFIVHKKS